MDLDKDNQWIYDVLEGRKEKELRVHENDEHLMNLDWGCSEKDA